MAKSARTRLLVLDDVSRVLEIEAKISNPSKPVFDIDLEATCRWVIPMGDSLAIEIDGRLIGFVLGHVRSGDFGLKGKTGWFSVIAVDPEYQGQGYGFRLGTELLERFKKKGASKVQTMLRWNQGDLITYLSALGFEKSPLVVV
ncbi:MAG TPA: GNAT family N-acetyltransferase, partial [Candidatus Hodarchaeales archaeon]|nr:GNAT family N-acetyltransferase [Candidatus Hodarchaeales archaeon]